MTTQQANATKTATFVMPTRAIKHGEYGGAYGALTRHQDIFFQYFRLRSASMHADVTVDEVTGLTTIALSYTGKLGKRNMEEIERFWNCGFLSDLVY